MVDPENTEPADEDAKEDVEGEEDAVGNASIWGLFLVPAMLVVFMVGLVWVFQLLTVDRPSIQEYSRQLRSSDKATRWQAALELVQTNQSSPDLLPILFEMLDASDEEQTLSRSGWTTQDILKRPEERALNMRWYATAVLGNIGGQRAFEKLMELTSDGDDGVRFYAVNSLGKIRDPKAVDRLIEMLSGDADAKVRTVVAYVLGEIADPRTTEALVEAYKTDTHEEVRWNSAVALARFGDPTGRATLEEMRSSDNATHRVEARKALRLLDKAAATAP